MDTNAKINERSIDETVKILLDARTVIIINATVMFIGLMLNVLPDAFNNLKGERKFMIIISSYCQKNFLKV